MNLEFLLKYVKSVTDLQALQTISKEVQQRYHQLVQKKRLEDWIHSSVTV